MAPRACSVSDTCRTRIVPRSVQSRGANAPIKPAALTTFRMAVHIPYRTLNCSDGLLEGVIVMDKRLYEARTGYGAHVHHPPPTAQHEWLSTSAAPYGSHSTLSQESTSLRNTRRNNLVYAASCCLAPTVDMEI